MLYTLKLDASYRPIDIIDSFKSTSMVLSGRAKVLEYYQADIYPGIKTPLVIVLKKYIRRMPFTKRCNRVNVAWRDKNTCQYCGQKFFLTELTMDHVYPKSKGGIKIWTNIVAACKKCNSQKDNKTLSEAKMSLLNQPVAPKITFFDIKMPCEMHPSWEKYK